MASARRAGTNESISDYEGLSPDYTEGNFSTWEAATDNDNVSGTVSPVLEVYAEGDSGGLWDDADTLDNSTNNATYFRIVRAASGEGHSGIPLDDGSQAGFRNTALTILGINETFSQIQDLTLKSTTSNNTSYSGVCYLLADEAKAIGILVFDSTGTYNAGYRVYPAAGLSCYIIDCLAHNVGYVGFYNKRGNNFWYNGVCDSNPYGCFAEAGTGYAKNVIATSNTNYDWNQSGGSWSKTTSTAESASVTYVNAAANNFHLDPEDTTAIDNGTDLSGDSDFPFDDDVDGDTWTGSWNIGFDEIAAAGPEVLVIADSSHSHSAAAVTLSALYQLAPAGSSHALSSDAPVLSALYQLSVNEASHALSSDTPSLVRVRGLIIADSTHAHSVDNVEIVRIRNLTIADTLHAHSAEEPPLGRLLTLVAAGSSHAHIADAIEILRKRGLVVADTSHALTSDTVELTLAGIVVLVVDDSTHAHVADNIVLTRIRTLSISDASHALTSDSPVLSIGWKDVIIRGVDPVTGKYYVFKGKYKPTEVLIKQRIL